MIDNIIEQIQEGMKLWEKTVVLKPNNCYLGIEQVNTWAQAVGDDDGEIVDINIYAVRSKTI